MAADSNIKYDILMKTGCAAAHGYQIRLNMRGKLDPHLTTAFAFDDGSVLIFEDGLGGSYTVALDGDVAYQWLEQYARADDQAFQKIQQARLEATNQVTLG